jgi:hypothetical protein
MQVEARRGGLRGYQPAFAPATLDGVTAALSAVSYFGTPTNSAPINFPSSPISGA